MKVWNAARRWRRSHSERRATALRCFIGGIQGSIRWLTYCLRSVNKLQECGFSGDRHEQTSNVSVLHQRHPCLNIFIDPGGTLSLLMSCMKSRIHYPLFIAEKFLSSGLFAGPPFLPPNLLHRVSLKHPLSTLTSVTGLKFHTRGSAASVDTTVKSDLTVRLC